MRVIFQRILIYSTPTSVVNYLATEGVLDIPDSTSAAIVAGEGQYYYCCCSVEIADLFDLFAI